MINKKRFLYIDESGDASFYAKGNRLLVGKEGFKPTLIIGMVEIEQRSLVRKAVISFMQELIADPLYNSLPCINNPKGWYLHASYDNLEVQVKFIDFLRRLNGFKFYAVIGRKNLDIFHKKHNKNESEFYFDLVHHLLKDKLNDGDTLYNLYLSARNKSTDHKLRSTIIKTIESDNLNRAISVDINYSAEIISSKHSPELSIVDYMLWALQRYILKGERRFFSALEDKYELIVDLYDTPQNGENSYHTDNKFSIEKASPYLANGYIK